MGAIGKQLVVFGCALIPSQVGGELPIRGHPPQSPQGVTLRRKAATCCLKARQGRVPQRVHLHLLCPGACTPTPPLRGVFLVDK